MSSDAGLAAFAAIAETIGMIYVSYREWRDGKKEASDQKPPPLGPNDLYVDYIVPAPTEFDENHLSWCAEPVVRPSVGNLYLESAEAPDEPAFIVTPDTYQNGTRVEFRDGVTLLEGENDMPETHRLPVSEGRYRYQFEFLLDVVATYDEGRRVDPFEYIDLYILKVGKQGYSYRIAHTNKSLNLAGKQKRFSLSVQLEIMTPGFITFGVRLPSGKARARNIVMHLTRLQP